MHSNTIKTFSDIKDKYKVFFIDIWGVIYDGVQPYDNTVNTINELIASGKEVFFISNTPRPNSVTTSKLKEFGINVEKAKVVTSGDLVIDKLKDFELKHTKILHLGKEKNQDITKGLKLNLVERASQAEYILLTIYLDEHEDLNQFDPILKIIADLKIPTICANPDKEVVNGKARRYCAGYFAEKLENMGGNVIYYGKPHASIFEFAISKLQNRNVSRSEILMIGDTLNTDIKGAIACNIHSALVTTGNAACMIQGVDANRKAESLNNSFKENNLYPTWVINGLF